MVMWGSCRFFYASRRSCISCFSSCEIRIWEIMKYGKSFNLHMLFALGSLSVCFNCWKSGLRRDFNCKVFLGFFQNFWRTQIVFVGPLILLFWISGEVCSGFQSCGGDPLSVYFLASGVTPTDCIVFIMAVKPFRLTYLQTAGPFYSNCVIETKRVKVEKEFRTPTRIIIHDIPLLTSLKGVVLHHKEWKTSYNRDSINKETFCRATNYTATMVHILFYWIHLLNAYSLCLFTFYLSTYITIMADSNKWRVCVVLIW